MSENDNNMTDEVIVKMTGETVVDDFEADAPSIPISDQELMVDVGGFEGPLDVLLNLARSQKVDITQISILELADQYLVWVTRVRRTNLELAADYLVMAAWLAYLKSRLLLPELSDGDEPSGEELAAALAYQMRRLESMQEVGERLMARPRKGQDFYPRGAPEKFGYTATSIFEVSLFDLLSAYGEHTLRSNIHTLRIEPSDLFSPEDAVLFMTRMLGEMPDWTNLVQYLPIELKDDLVSRSALASTLVAALQLTKEGKLRMRQSEMFGPIYVNAGNAERATTGEKFE